jgi:hypothetical protein
VFVCVCVCCECADTGNTICICHRLLVCVGVVYDVYIDRYLLVVLIVVIVVVVNNGASVWVFIIGGDM